MKKTINILLTDDDEGILDILKSELKELDKNFVLFTANNGRRAFDVIREHNITE